MADLGLIELSGKIVGVKSPCIGVCKTHSATGLCAGCYRTAVERLDWSKMSVEEKVATISLAALRKDKHGVIVGEYKYHAQGR